MITPKLNVVNIEQKIIFHAEMRGQISDGYWENARPYNHHRPWMLNWDEISIDQLPEPGRTFNAMLCRYNFAAPGLLEAVGDRICTKINLYRILGERVLELIRDDHWTIPSDCIEYDALTPSDISKLESFGITRDIYRLAAQHIHYTKAQLKKDCVLLKMACANRVTGY